METRLKAARIRLPVWEYSRSSRKRPPREFEKVVVTRAGRLLEWSQRELRLYTRLSTQALQVFFNFFFIKH